MGPRARPTEQASPGRTGILSLGPGDCCADRATRSASATNFTFLVLVFSGSKDSASLSCQPTDGGLSSASPFPTLPKEEQNKPNQQSAEAQRERNTRRNDDTEHS